MLARMREWSLNEKEKEEDKERGRKEEAEQNNMGEEKDESR